MVAASILLAGLALAQPEPVRERASKPNEPSTVIDDFKSDVARYVIRLESRPDEALKLRDEPLFHWGNPARNGEDGALFIWLLDGRPEVVGTVFTYRFNDGIRRKHEYHPLASVPLTAEYQGRQVWAPRTAGVRFQPVEGAPPPAASPRLRLTQMKALARGFSVRMIELEGEQAELRLMPQPLIRYEPINQPAADGALFSFSLGTDPEALLLLEARVEGNEPSWQYAFARFHYVDLRAAYKGREVWHVEPLTDIMNLDLGAAKYQDSVYATYHVNTEPAAPSSAEPARP